MIRHSRCPLCSSVDISERYSCTDNLVSHSTFPVYNCKSCGFHFTQNYPDENEIGKYYESDDYISHSDSGKGLFDRLYRSVRRFMVSRKTSYVTSHSEIEKGRLLDIGSGTGYFASEMKKTGWDVTCIEVNEKARNYSKEQYGLDVFPPERLKDPDPGSYDCITLWHVLEHFYDPFTLMNDINRILSQRGVCIIALPNCMSSDAGYYKHDWAAWDVPRHLWHFTPESFKIFAENSGFIITGIKTLPFDVFYISVLSEKARKSGLPFIKGLVTGSFLSLAAIANRRKSSSLVYFLRRKG